MAAGAVSEVVLDRWRWNRAIEVPIGGLWEAVRVTRDLGEAALHRLRRVGEPVGLVFEVPLRGAVEFLVPCGTAASWPTIGGTVAVADGTMRWPAPGATAANGRRAICGRRWLVASAAVAALTTHADALCEAVAAAIAHERFAWEAEKVEDTVSETARPTFRTVVRGEHVEPPATIADVRAALPEERRAEFDEAVGTASARDLFRVVARWAMRTNAELIAEDEENFRRLEAGDFSGCVPAAGVSPREQGPRDPSDPELVAGYTATSRTRSPQSLVPSRR